MSTSFAMLFPGQGSQSVGMLSDLAAKHALVQETFSEASDVLDDDLWELAQSGPEEKLNQTEFTQPALLAADIATWRCWQAVGGGQPAFVAGHSLGEYAALVCADALSFADAIALVAARGKFMQAAVPEGTGAMAAILGLEDQAVEAVCVQALEVGVVSPANYNSVGQVVIAGEVAAVEKAMQLAKEAGAIAKKIPVSVPSHCALMQPAADQMAEKLRAIEIKQPIIKVIQNADVKSFESPGAIRDALTRQLIAPVRWVETIQFMQQEGITQFFECGPGKVLAGLNKRISKEITTQHCVL